jgi:DNA-binding response OmpR family regulator
MVRRGLGIEGFDVRVAAGGAQALAVLDEFPADVVVLDVMMPGLDGLDVLRRIRETSEVPVLFLSARDRVQARIAGLDAGADDYLPKPSHSANWSRGCARCCVGTRPMTATC